MKYFLIPAAAVCAALFAGCASQPSEEKALDFPAPSVTLTIQESGDAVPLRVGQYAKITLKENPTTGYSWYFKLDNGKRGPQPKSGQAVELVGERYLASNTRLAGAPGVREVLVKAARPGSIYVVGNCIREWEKNPQPEQTVRYRFDVTR